MKPRLATLLTIVAAAIAGQVLAEDYYGEQDEPSAELHFTRLWYRSPARVCGNNFGLNQPFWEIDYDDAERHFLEGIGRLTRVATGTPNRIYPITDDAIFNYPFLYAVEVGHWYLDDREAERLREYLLRGGFLIVDDFHGACEWSLFMDSMRRVFPSRPIVDIPEDDEIFSVLYDLDHFTQIYGIRMRGSNITYEVADDPDPHWRGVYDDNGRLMMAINHNMDLGDAWEHADDPSYPAELTALAYRFAVNYVIYAMTH